MLRVIIAALEKKRMKHLSREHRLELFDGVAGRRPGGIELTAAVRHGLQAIAGRTAAKSKLRCKPSEGAAKAGGPERGRSIVPEAVWGPLPFRHDETGCTEPER